MAAAAGALFVLETMLVPDHEFFQAFGRLEGKIDLILSRSDDVEKRLRTLENWRWKMIGTSSAVSFTAGVIASLVTFALKH